jgi:excisionase family DNA binding protein
MSRMLNTKEAAAALGISVTALQRWWDRDDFPFTRLQVGKRRRLSALQIEAFTRGELDKTVAS